jgi:hypothetical protein
MGGGLFNTPLYLNPKCLIFSLAVIIVYYLPKIKSIAHNIIMVFLLGTSAYIALAWYDVLYDCNDRFKPTLLGWMTKGLKPKEYSEQYEKLPLKTRKVIRDFDIFILFILVITFVYPFVFTGKTR